MHGAGRSVLALSLLGLLSGCGEPRLKPQGQLTKSGQPYLAREGEAVHIAVFPVNADGSSSEGTSSYTAQYDSQAGTFQVRSADGGGIPAGKYRFTVQINKNRKDLLDGRAGVSNSPFVHDVTNGKDEIVLDLDRVDQAPTRVDQAPGRGRKR